ncbi:MAG TPA: glycosyltransferase [Bacteroidales bacterium]|nr:glycosyltransferase [Bacteroidales bacterium]
MTNLSAIIYAHNNERTIRSIVIRAVDYYFDEVIVINSGSTDKTELAIKRLCNHYDFKYFLISENEGIGHALATGVERSFGETILFIDASYTKISDHHFEKMIIPVRNKEVDMIIGQPKASLIDYSRNPNKSFAVMRCFQKYNILPIIDRIKKQKGGTELFINLYYQMEGKKVKCIMLEGIKQQSYFNDQRLSKLETELFNSEQKYLQKAYSNLYLNIK